MSTVRIGLFITISILFHLTSITYCHPNESGINRHQNQKLSTLLKRETLSDVYHSLESFENDEESLPDSSQTPLKRSITCNCKSNDKANEEKKESGARPANKTTGVEIKIDTGITLDGSSGTRALTEIVSPSSAVVKDKNCPADSFREVDNFFKGISSNLQELSKQLSEVFSGLLNKTTDFKKTMSPGDFLDINKCRASKNNSMSTTLAGITENFSQLLPDINFITKQLSPQKSADGGSLKISTCIENIRNNITEFDKNMRKKFNGTRNAFTTYLTQLKDSLNPLKAFNITIFDDLKSRINQPIVRLGNQTTALDNFLQQNAAVGVLGTFIGQLTKGITGFFHIISKKWSHANKHPHHHGVFGSIKHVLGWPSHVHPEPHFFHRIFGLPHLHSKHHDHHVPLLKKVFKIPDHHYHHRHHHHGSIIKYLLNSLYSIFHLSDHCECPQGSKCPLPCPVSHFFNWLSKPIPHHYHHKHVPGHINLHHNVKHKQPACSCS